jgi:vitamin B12 transporter
MRLARSFGTALLVGQLAFAAVAVAEETGDQPQPAEEQQEPAAETPVVVVTATRLEENAREVASYTTVISASEMERSQHRFVLDALRHLPGLDVVQAGPAGGATSVFLRGANSEHTLVLVDGVEANDAISPGRTFNFAHLTDDNIDRIEVVRGPQSVLYGSDAIGGVINIITKTGRGDPRVSVRAEGGGFGTYRVGVGLVGASDEVNYSMGASRYETNGFSAADQDLGNLEDDGYENTNFSTRLGITPADFFDLNLYARFVGTRADIDNGGGAGRDDINNVVKHDQWLLKVEPRLMLFGRLWEQKLGLALTEVSRENDNGIDPAHPDDLTLSAFESRISDVDWQHNLHLHASNILTVGLETEEDRGESLFHSESPFGPFTSAFDEEKVRTWGGYAQNKVRIAEQFAGTAGVRADDHEKFGRHVTYRLTSAYLFDDRGTKARATLGTGFKAPSLFQLFSSFGDPTLQPEESLGWDVGVDQQLWGNKTAISLTWFRNDFDNLIDFDNATNRFTNLGGAETRGIEFAALLNAIEDLGLQVSYTYTDANDKATGQELLRRARHKGSVTADYSFVDYGNVSLIVGYVGERDDNDFSTFPATRVTLDDYFLVNLAASYEVSESLQVFGRVENLLNENYVEVTGFGVPGIAAYVGIKPTF